VTYFVPFFIEVTNRHVSLGRITRHPDSCWMEQVARNATMQDRATQGDTTACGPRIIQLVLKLVF
jgi:hypothetical protein